ncbi:MAG: CPBP family intramembrane metalloprotease [Sphingobacteriales bacterium]|nr:CPBP family intramembrane metalloprotease [Sphingobacteriales bacterium]
MSKSITSPGLALLKLLVLVVSGMFLFSLLGLLAGSLIYKQSVLVVSPMNESVGFLRIVQLFSSVGSFLLPAWWFAKREGNQATSFFKLNTATHIPLFILTALLFYFSSGFFQWTIDVNQAMHLPDSLVGVEKWMRQQEDQLATLTQRFLYMPSAVDLAINLLMIALIPAIGEELLFRGCLQPIFGRLVKNAHVGIWLAAIVFSAIHLQFYGFIPRMLLGALFGYLYYYGNSMWYPILGHFLNNGSAVVAVYFYQQKGLSVAEAMKQENPADSRFYLLSVFLSATITIFLFYKFYQIARQKGPNHQTENHEPKLD